MSRLEMKRVDLGELYSLLELYGRTYSGVPEELLEEIAAAYKRQGGNGRIQNPRGAGRKRQYNQEKVVQIRGLREEGLTIRKIAEKTGCSVGYVQGVLSDP